LWRFWWIRGLWREGNQRLTSALQASGASPDDPIRARALHGGAVLARGLGDHETAHERIESSIALARDAGHREALALSLKEMGNLAYMRGDHAAAMAAYEESLLEYR